MTKLRGGAQLSQSGVGFGIIVKFQSSFGLDEGDSLPFMVILTNYMYGNNAYIWKMAKRSDHRFDISVNFEPIWISSSQSSPLIKWSIFARGIRYRGETGCPISVVCTKVVVTE